MNLFGLSEVPLPENIWRAVILILSGAVLGLTLWCLSQGITIVFMHLYYLPIVLLAYHYRKTGVYLSILLSLAYLVLVFLFEPESPDLITGALIRSMIFIAIAVLVAYLAEHLVQAREVLWETAQIQQEIVRSTNVWLILLDRTGKIIEWNRAAEEISGYTKEEVIGKNTVWKALYPDQKYRREITTRIKDIISSDNFLENLRTTITCRDGTRKTILWNTRILPRKKREIERYIAIGVDITAAVSAEEELQESEEKFRGVAERSSDIIQLTDRTGRMMYISPSVKRILGFEPDELIGSPPEKLVHPDELPLVQDMIRKNIESGGAVESIETRVLRKDGKYALLEVSVSPIIKDRAFAGMQIMARDVTERKAAQARIEELQKEQKEQMEIINTGPVIVFLWKAKENWPVETVSSNISQYGYTTGDFISGRISYGSIIHPDDLPRVTAEVEYNGANKTDTFYQTYRIFDKDRNVHWIDDFTKIRRDDYGTITHYQGIILDATERKKAEMERDRLVSVIRHSSELVGLSGPDRKIMFINEAGAAMLGVRCEDAIGRDFTEFLADSQKEMVGSSVLPAIIRLGRWEGDLKYRNVTTGQLVDVHAMTFLIKDPVTGAPQFLATVSLDITARKRAEAELKRYSERLEELVDERTRELREAQEELVKKEKLAVLGKLAGGVGHELRNPLGAVKNAAYFLNMVLENPEPDVRESLEIMNKEITRSEDILGSLLDFARPTVLTVRKTRINNVLSEAAARNPLPENVRLAMNLDENLPLIMADPDKLLQVFTNLITNAIQAMPAGGDLTVTSSGTGPDGVMVSVSDTGTGITEENKKKLFEPLFTTKAKGIGLGLVVTKSIVEAHKGSIAVESGVGKGTTFTVRLPIGIGEDEHAG